MGETGQRVDVGQKAKGKRRKAGQRQKAKCKRLKAKNQWSILFLYIILSACQPNATKQRLSLTPAFYYWKTELAFSESEKNYLQKNKIPKLYLRFFDVDWQAEQAVPQGELIVNQTLPPLPEIVPTIFITNRTLQHLSENDLPQLSQRIHQKIMQLAEQLPKSSTESNRFREVQIDCDWSGSTREKYFTLLRLLQQPLEAEAIILSATIRLHQIKYYRETGVPPVARGMLMFYNMSSVTELQTTNSILDLAEAEKYLNNFHDYPLPLDLALPIYNWGVVFRGGRFFRLIHNLADIPDGSSSELADNSRFQKLDAQHYQLLKSTYLRGHYLYKNDVIRLEQITQQQLMEAARLLQPLLITPNLTVSFYHLDSIAIQHHPYENLQKIIDQFATVPNH